MSDGPAGASVEALLASQKQAIEGLAARVGALELRATPISFETLLSLIIGVAEPAPLIPAGLDLRSDDRRVALAQLCANRAIFTGLVHETSRRVRSWDSAYAIRAARVAAEWGCYRHPGLFASRELEASIYALAAEFNMSRPVIEPVAAPHSVLHVATVVSAMGGHSRNIGRWADFDSDRTHRLVITEQNGAPIPPFFESSMKGGVRQLDGVTPEERLEALQEELAAADLAVLHVHPYDVVAAVAIADPTRRPRVFFMDHNDHLFGVGAALADVVVNFRPMGSALAMARRGVTAGRAVAVPLPIDPPAQVLDRSAAKRRLGIDPATGVLTTMALRTKYRPFLGLDFCALAERVLSRRSRPHLFVVGQEPSDPQWAELVGRFPERVHVVPPTSDTGLYLAATDLYLDSIPMSSQTSLLEAAAQGSAVLTLRHPAFGMLVTEDVDEPLAEVSSEEGWVDAVLARLDDLPASLAEGERVAATIARHHYRDSWLERIEELYESVERRAALPPEIEEGRFTDYDITLVGFQQASESGRDLVSLLAAARLITHELE